MLVDSHPKAPHVRDRTRQWHRGTFRFPKDLPSKIKVLFVFRLVMGITLGYLYHKHQDLFVVFVEVGEGMMILRLLMKHFQPEKLYVVSLVRLVRVCHRCR